MKMSCAELSKLVCGALKVTESCGMLDMYRLNDRMYAVSDALNEPIHSSAHTASAVRLEFVTDGRHMGLYCECPSPEFMEYDTVDVYVNGAAVFSTDADRLKNGGRVQVDLGGAGQKTVVVYFPCVGLIRISDFECDGAVRARTAAEKGKKALFFGDSITQGFGTLSSGMAYVNIFGRLCGYDVTDLGIGGYYYDEKFVCDIDGYRPDIIFVALGTNQLFSADRFERVREFYRALDGVYRGTPTVVITPVWRENVNGEVDKIKELAAEIKRVCARYGHTVIDGLSLIPNDGKWYRDGLHPSAAGAMLYAVNLRRALVEREIIN